MPRFLKKYGVIIIIVFVVIIVVLAGVFGYLQFDKLKKQLTDKDMQIQELESTIWSIGDLITVYAVRADVVAGKEILEEDLEPIDVPVTMATNLVSSIEDVVGKYYKISLTQGTALSYDMILESKIDDSTRYLDVVTDENPLGLKPGAYVDIRISMPFGEDFVAMTHKRVNSINNGILKLEVSETDIHIYNSMLVDKIIYPGTRIYAVEYVEPGVQKKAETYYPVSKNVLAILEKDPNLTEGVKGDIVARRDQLEVSLTSAINSEIAKILQQGKTTITQALEQAQHEIEQRWEEERQRLLEEQQGGY